MASKAIGFLNFKFGADLSGFERAMKKAQKNLKKFGKNIQKTGQNLSRNLTLPILGLGAAALKFGSDLEETDAKFKTVFSSIQKEAEKTAQSLKENFGLSELAAKEMLSGTGDLLVGFGFTEEKALELSNSVNELAVDLASFTNFSGGAEGASQALTKALLGERESIKSLGIAITETDLKKYAADHGLVWKELDRVTKAQLTFEMAQKQSSKAIGDFERTSGSFANQARILQGDLVDIASEIGARLIPFAQAFIEKLKGLVKWFDGLSESTKDNIVKWGLILAAIGPVLIIVGKMSVGLGSLIGGFKKLVKWIATNPYLALAGAITLIVAQVAKLIIQYDGLTSSQRAINNLNQTAASQILKQKTEVERLTDVLKDENTALEDKEIALKKLQGISPTYYGNMTAATLNVKQLDTATKDYIATLLTQAKIEAGQNLLVGLMEEQIQLSAEIAEANEEVSTGQMLLNIGKAVIMPGDALANQVNDYKDLKRFNELQKDITAITDLINTEEKKQQKQRETAATYEFKDLLGDGGDGGDVVDGTPDVIKTPFQIDLEKLEKNHQLALNQLKQTQMIEQKSQEDFDAILESEEGKHLQNKWDLYNQYEKDVTDLDSEILDHKLENTAKMFSAAEDQFEGIIYWQKQLTDAQLLLNAGVGLFGDILGSSLNSALDSQENFFQVFVENIKKAVRELLIQLAIMTMIDVLMGGKNLSKALITGNAMKVMGLADGGIVSGPTTALIGEYPGASSNPEVVAPLDKLKSMIGGGSSNVTVQGRLVGSDIFLSNERTKFNRNRTV